MDTAAATTTSNNDEVTSSPNALFLTIQSAMDSLCHALETKLKNSENENGAASLSKEVTAIISLLELLRRIGGCLVAWDNNGGALFGEFFFFLLQQQQ